MMEQVIDFTMKYGPLAGLVIILLLIIWGMSAFILNIYDRKFKEYDEKLGLYQGILGQSASSLKMVSHETIQAMQLESNLIRVQMQSLQNSLVELKSQVTKEILGLKQHSIQIHERSEDIKKIIDGAMEKVGRVLDLKERVDMVHGRIAVLETKVNRTDVHHRANMQTIAEKLGKQAIDIANIKKGKI